MLTAPTSISVARWGRLMRKAFDKKFPETGIFAMFASLPLDSLALPY